MVRDKTMPEDTNPTADEQNPQDDVSSEQGAGGEPDNATPNTDDAQSEDGEGNEPDESIDPPVKERKSVKDFIIARKQAKIDKLKTQKEKGDDDNNDDDDDDILPEDRNAILKTIAPIINPLIEKSLQAEDENEIQSFIKDNPEFAPFVAKARKFMSHPSRRNIPVETIFMEAAGGVNGVMKLGAQRLKNITDKAKNGTTGGASSGRAGDTGKSWDNMSVSEFEAEKQKLLSANRA